MIRAIFFSDDVAQLYFSLIPSQSNGSEKKWKDDSIASSMSLEKPTLRQDHSVFL